MCLLCKLKLLLFVATMLAFVKIFCLSFTQLLGERKITASVVELVSVTVISHPQGIQAI